MPSCGVHRIKITVAAGLIGVFIISMGLYYPLEYPLMEITKSLLDDIEIAPDWFHSAITKQARVEVIEQPLGKVKYQVWDRNNSDNIVLLIMMLEIHVY